MCAWILAIHTIFFEMDTEKAGLEEFFAHLQLSHPYKLMTFNQEMPASCASKYRAWRFHSPKL